MAKTNLNDFIGFNSEFRNAINLYLSLNKPEKISSYIPTKSSVNILNDYIESVLENTNNASLLIGPYGKGKSHLLLVLLSILSLERNKKNSKMVSDLIGKIAKIDDQCKDIAENLRMTWEEKRRFLPVILMNSQGDLNQTFLIALNDALKREGMTELTPETYYSHAIHNIKVWQEDYKETFKMFEEILREKGLTVHQLLAGLSEYNKESLGIFSKIYPKLTSGGTFNPMVTSEVLPLYKNISEKLCDDYNYGGIYIVFDEFSKYIESQDNKSAGSNMKLLQDMCELAAESKEAPVFITMVAHKSIKEYGKYLSTETINSFTGIEGRLQENYFITSSKNNYELIQNAIIKDEKELNKIPNYENLLGNKALRKFYKIPFFSTNFTEVDFDKIILKGCYPLSPISAYLLLNVSEKVAQNERTLFTFISKDEPYSMMRYVKNFEEGQSWLVQADLIYDYFKGLFKKDVNNEFIHTEWLNAEYAISKCETLEQTKMLKTLAIMIIVHKEEEMPTSPAYLSIASGLENAAEVLSELEALKLIYKKSATGCYVFKTRAGSQLKNELRKRREIKGELININKVLLDVTDDYYILPRKYNQEFAMTRYYRHEYMQIEKFNEVENVETLFDETEFCDGKLISLYLIEKDADVSEVVATLKKLNSPKLIVQFVEEPLEGLKFIKDYEILQDIKRDYTFYDSIEILQREIPILEEDLAKVINAEVAKLYGKYSGYKLLYLKDKEFVIEENGSIEAAVNQSCELLYNKTPIINNEIINKRELTTGATKKTRKVIIDFILSKVGDKLFYAGTNQEATIYRSLLVNTGIESGDVDMKMNEFLGLISKFIDECSDEKKSISELIKLLTSEPYAIRLSVIPVYLAYVISQRKEDIIVYFNDLEVQVTSDIIINMCENPQDYMVFVSKDDIEKERYISALQELFDVKNHVNLSDTRIRNIHICMQRWFRALPQVTRTMNKADGYEDAEEVIKYMSKVRNLIQKIDGNPYEIIFMDIPKLFSCSNDYVKTFKKLALCKKCFDGYYDWLNMSLVQDTLLEFDRKGKNDLYHTLKEWYDKQSAMSKKGLHDGRITNFMTCIENLSTYDETSIVRKVIKSITNVYVENWNDFSYEKYLVELRQVKEQIENIKDYENNQDKFKLEFIGSDSQKVERYYERADEKNGSVLRNILEDTLEEHDDLSVNDRVAILLEMIEKIIR